jgi:hypothetical protein
MEEKKKAENGTFGQVPHILLYGLPDVPAQDKWALASLIGLTWLGTGKTDKEREGPYKLSLREIANITGVQHASLRSKGGKAPREGVLDRLQAIGYITFFDAKPIDRSTGKVGRKQTYLIIHLERIWKDNAAFVETWNKPSPKPALWGTYQEVTVDEDNSHIVDEDNITVDHDNNDVDVDNDVVDQDNVTVDDVSTKSPTILTRPSQTFSEHTEADPSLNQNLSSGKKPIGTFYKLEPCIKDLLLLSGEYWNRKDHIQRLQQIYLECDIDDEDVFLSKVTAASKDAMKYNGNLEWFYQCLCSALHLEQAN